MTAANYVEARIRSSVQRGAELLDQKGVKDWYSKVDLDTLQMYSLANCVLGQLYGSVHDGLKSLQKFDTNNLYIEDEWQKVCFHGFSVNDYEDNFDMLGEMWREAIEQRRQEAGR